MGALFLASSLAFGNGKGDGGKPGGAGTPWVLTPFPSDPAAGIGQGGALPKASRIAFCSGFAGAADEPAVKRLEGCWIVAGEQGLHAFSPVGEAVALNGPPVVAGAPDCRAVAVLPPAAGPASADAPRLACSVSRPGAGPDGASLADQVFLLGPDGTWRELALGNAGAREHRRRVSDLALDRDGQVYVAFGDGRDILRIDLAGSVIRHAHVPGDPGAGTGEAGEDPGPAGILAMVLDPETGDLLVADRAGIRRVTASGVITGVFERRRFEACHLALHGSRLLIADPLRGRLHALDLDSGHRMTLLGRTGAKESKPDPVGPLAATPSGGWLLAVGKGYSTFALPRPSRPKPPAAPAKSEPTATPPASGGPAPGSTAQTPRQRALAHFREAQLQVRNHKKRQRELRRRTPPATASSWPGTRCSKPPTTSTGSARSRFAGRPT
jgi:hypothetical protein